MVFERLSFNLYQVLQQSAYVGIALSTLSTWTRQLLSVL